MKKKPLSSFILEALEPRLLFSGDVVPPPPDVGVAGDDGAAVLETPLNSDTGIVQESAIGQQVRREVVFVDLKVSDFEQLISDILSHQDEGRQIDAVVLVGEQDGVTQISEYLRGQQDIRGVHIISHGSEGTVGLGNVWLNLDTLDSYADEIEGWRQALTDDADLLFYGCNLAGGQAGEALLESLHLITGADVAASDDATGNAALGGDWDLEYHAGSIETDLAVDADTQQQWQGLLPNTAPTLDNTKSPTLTAQNEEDGAPVGAVGTLVSSLVDFASPAGQIDNVTDPNAGALLGIAVTDADTTNGTWHYSIDNGANWNPLGAVTDTNARLLAANSNQARLYFQPNADYNGTLAAAITFRAWDQTSGSNGGTAETRASGTMLDTFSAMSYSNNDGTAAWSSDWVDIDGLAAGGDNRIKGTPSDRLEIRAANTTGWIYREANLAAMSSATISFDYNSTLNAGTGGLIYFQVSSNGGSSYTTLATFSDSINTGTGTFSADISAYASSNTRIRFLTSGVSSPIKSLEVDNVQIDFWSIEDAGGTSAFSTADDTASLVVIGINDAPVLAAIGNQTVNELSTLSFTATATDIDLPADTLTFSLDAASLALGMTIDANTGAFSWTPTESQGGLTPSVTITVTDDETSNLIDSETFTITVNDVNVAPVLGAIGNQSVTELATLSFTATATDSDLPSDTLAFSLDAASLALGMTIDANTGAFSWTPPEAQGGTTPSVTFSVTDDGTGNLVDSETFTITVNDVNVAPVLGAIGNQSVTELATLSFTATATDSDLPADTLTFSLDAASLALGMTIDANTGAFSWTPTKSQGGLTPSVTITVTDNGTGNLVDSETFTITVNDVNISPVLGAIGNQSVDELATLTFTATATDSDLDTLTFSLDAASLALGMTIDANTGTFSWTPTESQGGLTPSVTITVTDSGTGNLIDSETFTIRVVDIDLAPVASGVFSGSVTEGNIGEAPVTTTGTISISDADAETIPSFDDVGSTLGDNAYGSFVLSSGTWTYTLDQSAVQNLNPRDTVTDTHTFIASDGTAQVVSVTITGTADTVVIASSSTESDTDTSKSSTQVTTVETLTNSGEENIPRIEEPLAGKETEGIDDTTDDIQSITKSSPTPKPLRARIGHEGTDPIAADVSNSLSIDDLRFDRSEKPGLDKPVDVSQFRIGAIREAKEIEMPTYDQESMDLELAKAVENTKAALDEAGKQVTTNSQIAIASSLGLSVGLGTWLLRIGSLATTMLSSMPLWKRFDPLPVLSLSSKERKKKLKDQKNIEVEEAKSDEDTTRILDAHHTNDPENDEKAEKP